MARSTKRWVAAVGAIAVAGAVWWAVGGDPEAEGARLLEGRLWIDRMPNSSRDMIGKFAVLRSVDHGPFGVAERGSVWRHRTEVFQWSRNGTELKIYRPQDRQRATFEVRTWRCEDAPKPFELCLELKRGNIAHRLYSRRDWRVTPRPGGEIQTENLPEVLQPVAAPAAVDESAEASLFPSGPT